MFQWIWIRKKNESFWINCFYQWILHLMLHEMKDAISMLLGEVKWLLCSWNHLNLSEKFFLKGNSSRIYCFTKIWLRFFQFSRSCAREFFSDFFLCSILFVFCEALIRCVTTTTAAAAVVVVAVDTKLFKWYKYLVWENTLYGSVCMMHDI